MDFAFLKLIFFRKVAFSSKLGNKDSSGVIRKKAEEGEAAEQPCLCPVKSVCTLGKPSAR